MTVPDNSNIHYPLYVFLSLFRILKPARLGNDLSINLLLVLVACYVYTLHEKVLFCVTDIKLFLSYYNSNRMNKYFEILQDRNLLIFVEKVRTGKYYKLSPEAIKIIDDIKINYNSVLYTFFNKYSIEL